MKTKIFPIVLFLLILAGCVSNPLPPGDEVAQVQISVMRMPDEKAHAAAPRVAKLTKQADIAEFMAWFNGIDWSQSGQDMAAIRIQQADGSLEVTTEAGVTKEFGFYWDGKFTRVRENRLIRAGDMTKLKDLVKRVIK